MFTHTCTSCTRRQLIFPTQITSVTGTTNDMTVSFTCWCGSHQSVETDSLLSIGRTTRESVAA